MIEDLRRQDVASRPRPASKAWCPACGFSTMREMRRALARRSAAVSTMPQLATSSAGTVHDADRRCISRASRPRPSAASPAPRHRSGRRRESRQTARRPRRGARAQHRVAETERLRLPDVDAVDSRRSRRLHRLRAAPSCCASSSSVSSSYALSKWSSIDALVAPGDEDHVGNAGGGGLFRPRTESAACRRRAAFPSARLGRRQEASAEARPPGNTAFVILRMAAFLVEILVSAAYARPVVTRCRRPASSEHWQAEFHGLCKLGPGIGAGNHVAGFSTRCRRDLPALGFDPRLRIVARQARQRAGQHEREAREAAGGRAVRPGFGPMHTGGAQVRDHLAIVTFREESRRCSRPAPARRRALPGAAVSSAASSASRLPK